MMGRRRHPKLAPPATPYTPHRLPPLAQAAPDNYLCLAKALMDEPVRIPDERPSPSTGAR